MTAPSTSAPGTRPSTRAWAGFAAGVVINLGWSVFFLFGTDGSHDDTWWTGVTALAITSVATGVPLLFWPPGRSVGRGLLLGTVCSALFVAAVLFVWVAFIYPMSGLE